MNLIRLAVCCLILLEWLHLPYQSSSILEHRERYKIRSLFSQVILLTCLTCLLGIKQGPIFVKRSAVRNWHSLAHTCFMAVLTTLSLLSTLCHCPWSALPTQSTPATRKDDKHQSHDTCHSNQCCCSKEGEAHIWTNPNDAMWSLAVLRCLRPLNAHDLFQMSLTARWPQGSGPEGGEGVDDQQKQMVEVGPLY